ncbi:MAG: trypsin-like peptidase domain-containing protein [Phycisphaerae bacterium]|jgi:S1-C subfamily serine protease|nr:trypsin-like peptidase domain-containing protein [Phycisphaerae bacterium]
MVKRLLLCVVTLAGLRAGPLCAVRASGEVSRITPVVIAHRKAGPAVVNISAEKIVTERFGLFGGDPFANIFRRPVRQKSAGSGVIIHGDGYVVTNAHVVSRAMQITIQLSDKTRYAAKVISSDSTHDLAILKVELPKGKTLPYLPLGRSDDLMVGETVIAIGNPLGFASTLTTGVISATDRKLTFAGNVEYGGLIQTDAPINPGNSGGPLLNIRGELIGINTAIRADAQNIGFAIAADTVTEQFSKLMDFERINRVVFGASVAQKRDKKGVALTVTEVRSKTPADGVLQKGDAIVSLNGKPVRQIPDFVCGMTGAKAGDKISLTVSRGGKRLERSLKLTVRPKPDGKKLARKLFGLTLRKIDRELARELSLSASRGLVVVGIEAGSPAHKLGIDLKDIIFQVGRFYVTDFDTLGVVLEDVKPGDTVRIGGARGYVRYWTAIKAARPDARSARERINRR